MLLSFIVPVYNAAAAFEECVASLRPLLDISVAEVLPLRATLASLLHRATLYGLSMPTMWCLPTA